MPSNLLPSGHGPAHKCNRCTQEPRSDVFILTTRGRHTATAPTDPGKGRGLQHRFIFLYIYITPIQTYCFCFLPKA